MNTKKLNIRFSRTKIKSISVLLTLFLTFGCNEVTAPIDYMAPETPQNFTLLGGGDGQARFRWTKSVENDFQFYRLYRSVNTVTSFSVISETTQNEYLDRFLDYDSTYYYYLVAVDNVGNESSPTNIVDVQPLNISAPQPPSFLVASAINNPLENKKFINLSWLPPDAGDLDYFKVYRGISPNFEVNKSSLIDSTFFGTYFDNFVNMNKRYYYKVTSVDRGKKESLPSFSHSDLILNSAVLKSPSNFSKFSSPFNFQWEAVDSAVAYKVFIGNSPFSDIIWESSKVKTNETNYSGSKLVTSKIYYWWVATYSREKITLDNGNKMDPQINSYSTVGNFIGE